MSQVERRAATVRAILQAAQELFAHAGFEATSIDDIAARAGVAKGAVYHHFRSKEAVFIAVLEAVQAGLAADLARRAARARGGPLEQIIGSIHAYLVAASGARARRILLIDGPVVIGWMKWREIDERYFGAGVRHMLAWVAGLDAASPEIEPLARVLMGGVMEAALACASARNPVRSAAAFAAAFRPLLEGLARASERRLGATAGAGDGYR